MRLAVLIILLLLIPSVVAQGLGNTILEGETKHIMVSDRIYEITLVLVADAKQIAVFKVNGELSDELSEREKHQFSDGSTLFVSNIYPNEAAEVGGADLVEFYFMGTGGALAREQVTRERSPAGYDDIIALFEQVAVSSGRDVGIPRVVGPGQEPLVAGYCVVDSDCDDGNGCTADGCVAGNCRRVSQKGCSFDKSVCVAPFTRMDVNEIARYCGSDNVWHNQGDIYAPCTHAYQCVSNFCLKGVCSPVVEIDEPVVEKPAPQLKKPVQPVVQKPAQPVQPVVEQPVDKQLVTQPDAREDAKIRVSEPEEDKPSFKGFFHWLFSKLGFW